MRFVPRTLASLAGCLLAGLPLPALGAQASSSSDSTAARVDRVFAQWDHVNAPGCALGVSRDGRTVYERGYGMSNLEHAIAITPQSIFHVASISKQLTAFSILLLEQEGKLSVNDDVRKYVPELPSYGKTITIDHLLHHTSGLRDQWDLLGLSDWREDDLITEDDVMRVVVRQKSLNFEPGAEYLYSNTGYTLLAVIVKRVSGKSLREFADERIFRPLGMAHTHFHDDHTMIVPGRTQAYQPREGGGWKISIPVFDTYGATSLFTTVGDLLLWEQNFADARVGGAALIARMTEPGRLASGEAITYARGVVVNRYRGLSTVGHSGADAGYRADVVRFPDQGLAIAAACNLANINPSQLTRRVAEIYLGDRMTPSVVAAAPHRVALDSASLARHSGVYWNARTEDALRFVMRDGALAVMRGQPVPLTAVSQDRFVVPGQPVEFDFGNEPGRPARLRVVTDGAPPQLLVRMADAPITAAERAAYAGRYYADELVTAYDVAERGDTLFLRSRRGAEYALERLAPDTFRGRDIGTVRFTRDGRGRVDAFLVTTGRVRRVGFARLR